MSEMTKNPVIDIEMENGDHMLAELYPDIAPKTVENFLKLVDQHFYDGLIFHRVINGFMIQGGCPDGTGMGGPGWQIPGEFAENGHPNPLVHTKGVLSMARAADPNSGGSQFFVMTSDSPHLDGSYAAFGKLLNEESMAVADAIVTTATPRTEMAAGKGQNEIADGDGNRVQVHQGNLDMPLTTQRIRSIVRVSQ